MAVNNGAIEEESRFSGRQEGIGIFQNLDTKFWKIVFISANSLSRVARALVVGTGENIKRKGGRLIDMFWPMSEFYDTDN